MGKFSKALELLGKIAEAVLTDLSNGDGKAYNNKAYNKEIERKNSEIKEEMHRGDDSITELYIPEGIKKIGNSAFRECRNLRSVTFPLTLEYIGCNAFTKCTSLTEVTIPEGVTYIGNGAFSECSSLVSAVLPNSMKGTEISGGLFYSCTALENVVFPKRIKRSFANVFPHCEALKSFEIPYGADELGAFTFEYCYSLERLIIPDTVKYIGHRSVMYCHSLREIYIPDSVERIACLHTFYKCLVLSKVRLPLDFTFKDILDDHTEDQAALCFQNCYELHTVEMCGREFHIESMTDEALLLIRTELAADGNSAAIDLICKQLPKVFKALADNNRTELADKLLAALPRDAVTEDELLAAIDYSAEKGAHEIYLMLVQYKNSDNSGSSDIGQRFSL